MENYIKDINGYDVLSYEEIEKIREDLKKGNKQNVIAAQRGGQENMLSSNAMVTIGGGSRGGPIASFTGVYDIFYNIKQIKDLREGDYILGSDLKPCKVLYNERHGLLRSYRLYFEGCRPAVASFDHTWSVYFGSCEKLVESTTSEIIYSFLHHVPVYAPHIDIMTKRRSKKLLLDFDQAGAEECYCLHVENSDELFVLEDGLITHNSKSFTILLKCLYNIEHPHFEAMILRKEKPDLRNIINDSKNVFKDYGTFLSSDKDTRWVLNHGGNIRFNYYADSYDDFKDRFQGQQYSLIAIDEITQAPFDKFKYLMTDLRNAYGIPNAFFGSCNPDHRSWLRVFIDYWISKEDTYYNDPKNDLVGYHPERKGLPIPERDGEVRYCFMAGAKSPSDIEWASDKHELYLRCKDRIDELYKKGGYSSEGSAEDIFIMSVCFTEAKLKDNKKLIESDPSYIARLANQDEEQIARDLEGNWDYENISEDYLSFTEMENFFNRPPDFGDGVLRAACDVAYSGGDNNWMWLLRGNCIVDMDVCQYDAQDNINHVRSKLAEWGVREENFTYDQAGVGQAYKGFFRRAVPFNGQETPYAANQRDLEIVKTDFDCLKSQCAYNLADAIKYGEITISKSLLERRVSGKGFDNLSLREVFLQERRFFNVDETKRDRGKGKCLYPKPEIKKWLHRSPDCIESLVYSRIFWVKKTQQRRVLPRGYTRYVRY